MDSEVGLVQPAVVGNLGPSFPEGGELPSFSNVTTDVCFAFFLQNLCSFLPLSYYLCARSPPQHLVTGPSRPCGEEGKDHKFRSLALVMLPNQSLRV